MDKKTLETLEKIAKEKAIELTVTSCPQEWESWSRDEMYDYFMESEDTPEDFTFCDLYDSWNLMDKFVQDSFLDDFKESILGMLFDLQDRGLLVLDLEK